MVQYIDVRSGDTSHSPTVDFDVGSCFHTAHEDLRRTTIAAFVNIANSIRHKLRRNGQQTVPFRASFLSYLISSPSQEYNARHTL
jgi:hypothetical protein